MRMPSLRQSGGVAGIHRQHGAGNVPAAFAKEMLDYGSDVVSLGQAAQRATAGDTPAPLLVQGQSRIRCRQTRV